MKRLFLLRHASAGFGTSDQTRPLSERGHNDALWLGHYLRESNLLPDQILCSSATRAKESQSQLLLGAETSIATSFMEDLYLASAEYVLNQIKLLATSVNALMIIGHNPGLLMLFRTLAVISSKEKLNLKFSPCTVGILDFDIKDWAELQMSTGQIFDVIVPSERIGQN